MLFFFFKSATVCVPQGPRRKPSPVESRIPRAGNSWTFPVRSALPAAGLGVYPLPSSMTVSGLHQMRMQSAETRVVLASPEAILLQSLSELANGRVQGPPTEIPLPCNFQLVHCCNKAPLSCNSLAFTSHLLKNRSM